MDFKLPELGEGVYEAELVAWLVKPGDAVKRGQNLMEVLTDKATMEVPSPFAGTIDELKANPGENLKVGQVVLTYTAAAAKDGNATAASAGQTNDGNATAMKTRRDGGVAAPAPAAVSRGTLRVTSPILGVKAAPSVRYMARKLGIDLAGVHGSGPGGRVLIDDLSAHVQSAAPAAKQRPPQEDYGRPGTRIKLQGVRRKIAEHMVLAKTTIPHYTYVDECEVTDLVRLRESLKEPFAARGAKLTYLAFFVKAVVAALKDVPIVNASLESESEEIVLHDRYNIGIAVASPSGLIVPVIHEADKKDLLAIARDIERLTSETRAGKVRVEDLRGGTFTITSVGGIGGLISTPVINHPEVAILGIGKVVKRPVFDATGNVRPADMIYLSLSFDHRVVDGAIGAAFCNAVMRRLQNPATLLLPEHA
jgi:2-oxoisovalerate dehydrogenase E2 component (dihydrolipoyl transacylase)